MAGADPLRVLEFTGGEGSLRHRDGRLEMLEGDPLASLAALVASAPGGCVAVGYLGYDLGLALERLRARSARDHRFPDLWFGLYDRPGGLDARQGRSGPCRGGEARCSLGRDAYRSAVRRVLDYIAAGDIYQANLTVRFESPFEGDPRALWGRLRRSNPAPYSAYLDCGAGRVLVGASPECFLRLAGGVIETRPIKGTRARRADPAEDRAAAQELAASPKDRAELAMIVDVHRNDLGRVCRPGSVEVVAERDLESFPAVHHLVATVRGRLRGGAGAVDAVRAAFPAGSITGAPKRRAMEVIDELEPVGRGVYTGAVGWFDPRGDAELCVAIRQVLLDGDRAFVHAGGGIVADSDPEAEHEELMAKAGALLEAVRGP